MLKIIFIIYLLILNLSSSILFTFDKNAAIKGRRRVPERTLHLLELMGGVFANWILMYTLRHKNRKFSYYAITYLLLFAWMAFLFLSISDMHDVLTICVKKE